MGILIVFGAVLIICLVLYLVVKYGDWYVLFLSLFLLVMIIHLFSYPPEEEYPNMAKVTIDGEIQTIYFDDYQQDGMKITIDNYAKEGLWNWTGWQLWKEHPEGIKIMLLDNEGQFKYTDRKSNKEINKVIDATQ